MQYTPEEETKHRAQFVEDCRQKIWNAACTADWTGRRVIELGTKMEELDKEHGAKIDEIEKLSKALDSHSVENRQKRAALQKEADGINLRMKGCAESINQGYKTLEELDSAMLSNSKLLEHAPSFTFPTDQENLNAL